MPRVSRMPDLYHDKTKGRYFVEKRVPKDVHAVIGGKAKRKQTFPRSVDYATAVRLTRDIVSAWEREWDAARPIQLVPVQFIRRRPKGIALDTIMMEGMAGIDRDELVRRLTNAYGPRIIQLPVNHPGIVRDEATGELVYSDPTIKPAAPASSPARVTIDAVIQAWANEYRERDLLRRLPGRDAEAAKRGVLTYLFEARGKPHDLRQITEADLKEHRGYLLSDGRKLGKRGRKPNASDHIHQIKTCFAVAERNGLLTTNPARNLQNVTGSDNTRLPFTLAERDAILRSARGRHTEVKWAHWIAAYTSAIQSELRYLTPAHFRVEDGIKVIDIKPPKGHALKTTYRPRTLPLHSALLAEGIWEYADGVRRQRGEDAPLFTMSKSRLERRVNRLVRELAKEPGLEGLDDPLKSHYSHRHFVLTELDGREIIDEEGRKVDASYIVGGHAPPTIHKKHYVKVKIGRLATAIETLPAV